jgi:uncharacterized YigZ family protein
MYCVNTSLTVEDTVKKSRFIGMLIPCQTEQEALLHLKRLQQQYAEASHLVFAYRIKSPKGIVTKFHDAGEPSGTAGKPVFQHLAGKDLINLLCVVVRYFGGVKLGAGGLTRAYSNAAKKVIEASAITEYIEYAELKLVLEYKELQNFEYQLKKLDGIIIKQLFSDIVSLVVKMPEGNVIGLAKLFSVEAKGVAE